VKLRRYRNKGRLYWRVDLGILNGRRVQKQFTTKSAAEKCLSLARQEVQTNGRAAMDLTLQERDEFVRARNRLGEVGTSITDAVDFFLARRPHAERPLRDAIDECLLAKTTAGRRPSSLRQLRHSLDQLSFHHDGKMCSEIAATDIERWLANPDWAQATRRSHLTDARTFFGWCLRRGYVGFNPCDRIENIQVEDKPIEVLTVDECDRLLRAALGHDRKLLPYIALGLFAGVRPEEIQRLEWHDIDLKAGIIRLEGHKAKTRRRRIVEMHPTCKAWLSMHGDLPPKNLKKRLDRVRAKAKISWPHDALRRTAASHLLHLHKDEAKVALMLGHSPQTLFAHYRELVGDGDNERFWSLTAATLQ